MEQNGYVTCWQDEDKRNKNVKLTAKVQSLGMDMEQHMPENEKNLLSPLNEAEAIKLKQMLIQIYNQLE